MHQKIQFRLILLVVITLISLSVTLLIGLTGFKKDINIVNSLYNDRIVPLRDLKVIADMYAVNIVDTSHKARNGNISWQEARKNVKEAQSTIQEKWQGYLATTLVEEEEKRIAIIKPMLVDTDSKLAKLYQILEQENQPALADFTIQTLYPAIDPISDQFAQLINIQLDVAGHDYQQMVDTYHTNQWVLLSFFVVALLLSSFLSFVLIKNLRRSLSGIAAAMHQARQGNFAARAEVHGNDEIADTSRMLNQFMEALGTSIAETNQVLHAIAHADFTQRVRGNYLGQLDVLKQGVNDSAESVSFMMGELEVVMKALHAGQFDVRMDTKVPQAFRALVETSLVSIDHVIADINTVMKQMNAGDFSYRVNAEARGELLLLKNNINASMAAIAYAVGAISEVVAAQAQGDLSKALPDEGFRGQLDALKNAINHSTTKLTEVVVQVVSASSIVNDAAQQVSQGSSDLSGRVQEQAAALEETSATMHEMASAVQANTGNALRAAELAHQVQGRSGDGVHVMKQTIDAMQDIRDSSHKIADIVTLIDSIAFQTNLLALNAAVEAARAGEHGRGFAVVAGEVRALAQKSAEAAKDIKGLIEESVGRVQHGTELAEHSGEVLSGITESVAQVVDMIEAIAHASSEQAEGIGQVHKAIADIDAVTQQNAALVEETTAAAESLSEEARDLRQSMAFFNTI